MQLFEVYPQQNMSLPCEVLLQELDIISLLRWRDLYVILSEQPRLNKAEGGSEDESY